MDEIHVAYLQFIPLVELIYSDSVREPLKFLASGLDLTKEIEKRYKQRREKKQIDTSHKVEDLSFRKYSNLQWEWNNDGFNYYKSIRSLIFDQQPVRPLISLATKSIKWKIDKAKIKFISAMKKIEITTLLSGIVKKRISIRFSDKSKLNLQENQKYLKRECDKEKGEEVTRILKGIFKNHKKINVEASDTITCVEIERKYFTNLYPEYKKANLFRIDDTMFYVDGFNRIFIIHDKSPSRLFRRRILKTIILAFSLKFLIRWMSNLLDKGILEEIGIREKTHLLVYTLASLDPSNYSSRRRLNLLLKHYQRIVFSKFIGRLKINKDFLYLKNQIKKKLEDMPTYEVSYFFNKKNIFSNRLRDEITVKLAAKPEPELTEKERIMLGFFVKKYKEELSDEGLFHFNVSRQQPLGVITRNFIRTNINKFLTEKGYPTNTFTETELKKPPLPNILEILVNKDLILVLKKGKGKADFHLYLNSENDFVKNQILISL